MFFVSYQSVSLKTVLLWRCVHHNSS